MTSDVLLALKEFFGYIWYMLKSIIIPGTNLTGAHLVIAPAGILVFILVVRVIVGASEVKLRDNIRASNRSKY